ncbi:hypothetical protein ABZV31_24680 [Streptomyces sp. NPDC005202]|uniref:hypothetical protein n=1 Tax=Streptomyces sp. NPDC005202 TaxID=3157021 RepID=UPI0033A74865
MSYIPVPALDGCTWPLSWRYRPTGDGRLVHTLLLPGQLRQLLRQESAPVWAHTVEVEIPRS